MTSALPTYANHDARGGSSPEDQKRQGPGDFSPGPCRDFSTWPLTSTYFYKGQSSTGTILVLKAPWTQAKKTYLDKKMRPVEKKSPHPPSYYAVSRAYDGSVLRLNNLHQLLLEAHADRDAVVLLASSITPDWKVPEVIEKVARAKGYREDSFNIRRKSWNDGIFNCHPGMSDEDAHKVCPGSLVEAPVHVLSFDIENVPFTFVTEDGYVPTDAASLLSWFTSGLAPELANASAVLLFTSNHGLLSSSVPEVRMRLFFLLDAPISVAENKWLTSLIQARAKVAYGARPGWTKQIVDGAAASKHQVCYTAAPEFYDATTRQHVADPIPQRVHKIVRRTEKVSQLDIKRLLDTRVTRQTPDPIARVLRKSRPSSQPRLRAYSRWEYLHKRRQRKDGRWNRGNRAARINAAFAISTAMEGNRHTVATREGYNLGWLSNTIPQDTIEYRGIQEMISEATCMFDSWEVQAETAERQFTLGQGLFRLPFVNSPTPAVKGTARYEAIVNTYFRRVFKLLVGMYKTGIPHKDGKPLFTALDGNDAYREVVKTWAPLRGHYDWKPVPHVALDAPEEDVNSKGPRRPMLHIERELFDDLRLRVLQEMSRENLPVPDIDEHEFFQRLCAIGVVNTKWHAWNKKPQRTTCSSTYNITCSMRPIHTEVATRFKTRVGVFFVDSMLNFLDTTLDDVEPFYGTADHMLPIPQFPDGADTRTLVKMLNSWRILQARHAFQCVLRVQYHADVYRAATGEPDAQAQAYMRKIVQEVGWAFISPVDLTPLDITPDQTLSAISKRDIHEDIIPAVAGMNHHETVLGLLAVLDGGHPLQSSPFSFIISSDGDTAITDGARAATRRQVHGAACWLHQRLGQWGIQPAWLSQMVVRGPTVPWGHNGSSVQFCESNPHWVGKAVRELV